MRLKEIWLLLLILCSQVSVAQDHSIARKWNEVLLLSIRNDFARPTVHARNLFHVSAAMYDAWAVFSEDDQTYLLGNTLHDFTSEFDGFIAFQPNIEANRKEAISYAAYRIIMHRFESSPGFNEIQQAANQLFVDELGYDFTFTSTEYRTGSAAALGNYIAQEYINYGFLDGANEAGGYENQFYEPVNEPISPKDPGNPIIADPNRWQPIAFDLFIDQSGNEIPGSVPPFLSPEWGNVNPFSLTEEDKEIKFRDGDEYFVYKDPGPPPYIDTLAGGTSTALYQWNFSMVVTWSAHLAESIEKEIDISPANLGNVSIDEIPTDLADHDKFYKYLEGGDVSGGHPLNPYTGEPYEHQIVKLGDYARILAEFWADGPDSETPPGHWFTILNYVNDHPQLVKRINGRGSILSDLEWDVKAYFTLGGAMHDVAITAWGIKGYYDYVRPISAIRFMADMGQSTSPDLPNYHIAGMPLVEGFIELVMEEDELAGDSLENLHKIKVKAWRGPEFIDNPETDTAGVGWILAENWWPYQRPTFITPNFAGYVSGHSTYSRAAAEVLTRFTGSEYFPGGMGEFIAPKNEFLVFENGPSQDIILQWATYSDASDQCSLSRIWGGIHPPADDLPGRHLGYEIGNQSYEYALQYFRQAITSIEEKPEFKAYPNPATNTINVQLGINSVYTVSLHTVDGRCIKMLQVDQSTSVIDLFDLTPGVYILKVEAPEFSTVKKIYKN